VRVRQILTAVAVLGVVGVWLVPAPAGASGGTKPEFEPGACPDGVPTDPRLECGTVTVPEHHGRAGGHDVVLAVGRIHPASGPSTEPPLLYVTGGPGDSALPFAQDFLDDPPVDDRDLILVDLRGTGYSQPSLECPEATGELFSFGAASDDAEANRAALAAIRDCKERLEADDIDLRAYDYTEISADLADVRTALGIDEWDVYGISNGGRVALELVRRHPQGVRALVLDAALPPQGNFFTELWPHGARAIKALFDACAQDATCNAAHPNLEARFWDMVESLRTSPKSVTGTDAETGSTGTVVFDDRHTLEILRGGLYDTTLIPIIPSLLDQLTKGEAFEGVANEVVARTGNFGYSLGEELSDNCREEVAYAPRSAFVRQAKELPDYKRVILDDTFRKECKMWDVGKADPSVDRPVRSKIPALLLVGEFDPVHPRESSEAIAKYLPNSTLVEFPGIGHGTEFAHPCPRSILHAFVADPEAPVDTSCVDAMTPPQFA